MLVTAIAMGDVKDLAEARAIVRDSFEVKRYEPKNPAAWDDAYGRYRQVLTA
jgi:rhamnulokinase